MDQRPDHVRIADRSRNEGDSYEEVYLTEAQVRNADDDI